MAELDRELRELWATDAGDRAWWASEPSEPAEPAEQERPEPPRAVRTAPAVRGSAAPAQRAAAPTSRRAAAPTPRVTATPTPRRTAPPAADRPRPVRDRAPRRRPAPDWLAEGDPSLIAPRTGVAEPSSPLADSVSTVSDAASPHTDTFTRADTFTGSDSRLDRAPATPRTVVIRGRGAEPYTPRSTSSARRRADRSYERPGLRPDRTAMWAVLLCLMVLLAAVASAHGAVLPR